MATERIESVEEIKARIAAVEVQKQAELDKKLADFDGEAERGHECAASRRYR
jgi:hypothetical protein